MKLKVILIAVFMTAYSLAYAQFSQAKFERAVDYLNCKAIELSLIKSPTEGVINKFKETCDCQNYPDYNTIKLGIATSETKTIALCEEIEKLKVNEYKPNLELNELIGLLTETIYNDKVKYGKIFEFAENRKNDNSFESFGATLTNELKYGLDGMSEVENQKNHNEYLKEITALESRISTLEEQLNVTNDSQGWFKGVTFQIAVLFVLILLGIMGGVIVFFLVFRKPKEDHKEIGIPVNIKNYVAEKIKVLEFTFASISIAADFRKLLEEHKKLKEQVEKIYVKPNAVVTPVQSTYASSKYDKIDIQAQQEKDESFYLSGPDFDGSFNDSFASNNYKAGASIYRFTKISSSTARFQIEDKEASLKLALQYPEKIIEPVCDAENAFNPKARTITTLNAGKAELEGGKWIIQYKAKIRYEN